MAPTGKYRIVYDNLAAPKAGQGLGGECALHMDDKVIPLGKHFAGPPVWSHDSKFVAIPQWITNWYGKRVRQRVVVIDIEGKEIGTNSFEYRLLHLKEFNQNIVIGMDNALENPKYTRIDTVGFNFKPLAV